MFIDTHAHLYLEEFNEDREAVMQRAMDSGVKKIFLPNIDSGTIHAMLDMEKKFPKQAFAMMGLHPGSVNGTVEEELKRVKEWLSKRKFVAVGEIGLDFYWDTTFKEQQLQAFSAQIDLALQYDLPIVIHSRNAMAECIEMVQGKQNGKLKGIFHCFSGTVTEAKKIVALGFYLGIGGVITFKKSTLPEVLKRIDLERLVLETDSPYLTPVPHRGKRNESSYIPFIAEKVAEIKGVSVDVVAGITSSNARILYNI